MEFRMKGVFVSLVTPFQPDGSLDLDSLGRLVENAIAGGADGFLLFDRFAEAEELSVEESARILRMAAWPSGKRVPAVVSISETGRKETLAKARLAAEDGAAALLLAPPRGPEPIHRMKMDTFRAVAKSVPVPVVLDYQSAGSTLPANPATEGLLDALEDTLLFRVDCSPVGQVISALRERSRNQAMILSGLSGLHGTDALERGAAGINPPASLARLFAELARLYTVGAGDDARRFYAEFLPLLSLLTQSFAMAAAWEKTVLLRRGWISSDHMRRPTLRPDAKHRADLFSLLEQLASRLEPQ